MQSIKNKKSFSTILGFYMKFSIFFLASCLLASTSLFTMEKRIEHPVAASSSQKRARIERITIKQENDDFPCVETIKHEPQESVAAAMSSTSNAAIEMPPVGRIPNYNYERDLIKAVESGQVEQVRQLLERPGIDVNSKNVESKSILLIAVENNYVDIVRLLLSKPSITINSAWNRTISIPLLVAAQKGYHEIVEMLLKAPGINSNVQSQGKSALMLAANYGHAETVRILLAHPGIAFNDKGRKGVTALLCATKNNHNTTVELLVGKQGIDINAQDNEGDTALIVASEKGRKGIVRMLLNMPHIALNVKNKRGFTALHRSICSQNREITKMLLEAPGIDIEVPAPGQNALMFAISYHATDMAKMLLGRPNFAGNVQEALIAAVKRRHYELVNILLDRPDVTINYQNQEGRQLMKIAIENDCRSIVERFLSRPGISIHDFATVIIEAARYDNEPILEMVLAKPGVDVNVPNENQETALIVASQIPWLSRCYAKLLERPEININAQGRDNETALIAAAGNRLHTQMLLANPHIYVNAQTREGLTALMRAVMNGRKEAVKLLLDHPGIDLSARTMNGMTALMLVLATEEPRGGYPSTGIVNRLPENAKEICVMLLNKQNIGINAQNNNGWTALMFAAKLSHEEERKEIIEFLLAKPGIDVNITTKGGETALSIAAGLGKADAVQMLVRAGANVQHAINFASRTSPNGNGQGIIETLRVAQVIPTTALHPHIAEPRQVDQQPIPALEPLVPMRQVPGGNPSAIASAAHSQAIGLTHVTRPGEVTTLFQLETTIVPFFNRADLIERLDPNTLICPLLFAAKYGMLSVVKRLLERQAQINMCDHDGNTALHLAIMHAIGSGGQQVDVALHLIRLGANINAQNKLGQTPLMLAGTHERLFPIFIELGIKGANQTITDLAGRTYHDYLADSVKTLLRNAPQTVKVEAINRQ